MKKEDLPLFFSFLFYSEGYGVEGAWLHLFVEVTIQEREEKELYCHIIGVNLG
jgi:hypothetical protein